MNKLKYELKRLEAICKMIDHGAIPYTGITVYIQNITHVEHNDTKCSGSIISANAYPAISITNINGETSDYPITLGN